MKIGFLGPKATFTDIAVRGLFPGGTAIPFPTIPACFDALAEEAIDLAVVPIENALEGSVNITLDYLIHEAMFPIVGEVTAPIRQHLMVHPANVNEWNEIKSVYSHSHAIAQCHKFLHSSLKGAQLVNTTSTAAAAKHIQDHPHEKAAAIANLLAAEEYGLEIVKNDIHDFSHNHTRFIVISKTAETLQTEKKEFKGHKTSVMVTLPDDRAGALHQVLSAFAWRKLNLSKIESRPMKTGLGNYFFIIDIDMQEDEVLIPGVTAELEALGCKVNILGSYPSFQLGKDSLTVS
ncbi:prephenate dehydratase [Cytobacillus purgationiresistens]|uniref:Prephenate dehydratase n=1 Tax=Cytobacillus purgationiresistens TaxID=863449 RepID=A0ABU0AFU5_9BACI|nr:prephenate dehydratase [Cytobacillus purgationiresistens]MDQ0269895.1 prephenate dehydratase [Cytobacillus purgationiresistens]